MNLVLVLELEAISTADVLVFCSYFAAVKSAVLLGEEVRTLALFRVTASKHSVLPVDKRSGFFYDMVPFPSLVEWPWL